ncbi:MAG TPA: TonB family protein [Oculatellaceae cyanobacterium]
MPNESDCQRPDIELLNSAHLASPNEAELHLSESISGALTLHKDLNDEVPESTREISANTDSSAAPVVPMYGVQMNFSKHQLHELLAVIGNHSAPEQEWLRACYLLGDYVHKPRRSNAKALIPLVACAAIAVGAAMPWYSHYVQSYQSSDWVPPPPPPVIDGNLTAYLDEMRFKIQFHRLALGIPDIPVAVDIVVDSHGDASGVTILKSSGDKAIDKGTIQAVKDSLPFSPPPLAMAKTMEVQMTLGGNEDQPNAGVDADAETSAP